MKLSISNIAWEVSQDELIAELLTKFGVAAIDVAPTKYFPNIATVTRDEVSEVRKFWNRRGIEIIGGQSLFFGRPDLNIFSSKEIRAESLRYLEKFAQISEELGIRKLVFGSPKNRRRDTLDLLAARSSAVDYFWQLGEIGLQRGIVFCLEPNPAKYGCDFMVNDGETFEMVNMVSHKNIALQLDTGAAMMNDDDIPNLLSDHSSAYGHIHLSATDLEPLHLTPSVFQELPALIESHLGSLEHMTIEMLTSKPENSMSEIRATLQVLGGGVASR